MKDTFDFESYARVKCGDCFIQNALHFVNEKLSNLKALTLKEVDFLLSIKLLLEK
jgi:hypothetical protein